MTLAKKKKKKTYLSEIYGIIPFLEFLEFEIPILQSLNNIQYNLEIIIFHHQLIFPWRMCCIFSFPTKTNVIGIQFEVINNYK